MRMSNRNRCSITPYLPGRPLPDPPICRNPLANPPTSTAVRAAGRRLDGAAGYMAGRDFAPKDDTKSMERPMFALSKNKDTKQRAGGTLRCRLAN
jgi:hypothetical protein